MTIEDFAKYESSNPTMHPNRVKIPVNRFSFAKDEDIKEFNEIYQFCLENVKNGNFTEFEISNRGAIRQYIGCIRGAKWIMFVKQTVIDIIIRNLDARYYRFQIGVRKAEDKGIYGRQAFSIYKEELLRDGVNLEELAIKNGKEIKETIPKAKVELFVCPGENRTYHNAHHIDLNSAFNAGMMKAFPILEPSIRRMYNKRQENEIFKDVLNMTQGFMQSDMVECEYAHISKAGYEWTNKRIDELSKKLTDKGYRILAYNTDGIWYQSFDNTVYHDEDEGPDIGQWKTDWTDCSIRFRSKGAYEVKGFKVKNTEKTFKYKPVVRGVSSYEKIKPRDEWEWGDIFKGEVIKFSFIPGIGVIKKYVID